MNQVQNFVRWQVNLIGCALFVFLAINQGHEHAALTFYQATGQPTAQFHVSTAELGIFYWGTCTLLGELVITLLYLGNKLLAWGKDWKEKDEGKRWE